MWLDLNPPIKYIPLTEIISLIYLMPKNRIMDRNMKKKILPWLKTVFSHV